jgi:hypothetical protein
MSYGPNVWGPHGWGFIHYITIGYPNNPSDQTKLKYKRFFEILHDVIPCDLCSDNYKNHLIEFPLNDKVLSKKKEFMEWGINMHNAVNKLNKKKIMKYDDAVYNIVKNLKYLYVKRNNVKNEEYLICKNESSIVTNSIMICMIIIIILLLYLKFR